MSDLPRDEGPAQQLRADAKRSIAAIIDAAIEVLGQQPAASMEDIAAAAGVSRQTIYAHFRSRDALLRALLDQFKREATAVLDAAQLDQGAPTDALIRFLDTGWEVLVRYPFLTHATFPPLTAEEDRELHTPPLEPLGRLIERGQASGDFDRDLPVSWILAATPSIAHTAGQEVRAGRMTQLQAANAVCQSIVRILGVEPVIQLDDQSADATQNQNGIKSSASQFAGDVHLQDRNP
jgi:AcrR family transcriptional regulator